MSVIIVLRVPGDPDAFEKYAASHADQMKRIAAAGKAAGAAHHMFAAGDGEIVVVDEWDTAEHFHAFFQSQTEIPELMAAGGATGQPTVAAYRVLDTPDAF